MSRLSHTMLVLGLATALSGPVRATAQESGSVATGRVAGTAGSVVPIWPGRAPGSEGWTQKEVEYRSDWDRKAMVRNVTTPTLTAFLPDPATATGAAVVVCPGGGFRFLSWQSEGTEVAEWLRARGRGVRPQVPAHGDPGVRGGLPQGDGGVLREAGQPRGPAGAGRGREARGPQGPGQGRRSGPPGYPRGDAEDRGPGHRRRPPGDQGRAPARRRVGDQAGPHRHHGLLGRRDGHDGRRDGARRGEPARLRGADLRRRHERRQGPRRRPTAVHPLRLRRPAGRRRQRPAVLGVEGGQSSGRVAHLREGGPRLRHDAEGPAGGPLDRAPTATGSPSGA